jgi:hypothetical protein
MECPKCHAPAKQVIFGMMAGPPTPEEEELYIFGGCVIDDWRGPVFECTSCHHQWSELATPETSPS